MFQSLTSYFYGSTADTSDQQLEATNAKLAGVNGEAAAQIDRSVRVERQQNLVTRPCDEHDDDEESEVSDWLLVDKEGKRWTVTQNKKRLFKPLFIM